MRALREASLVVLALQLASLAVALLGSSVSDHPLALTGGAQRLYVMSVDGVLSALDWEGRQVWSYQLAEPLFSSTLNYKTEAGVPLLVPGLNRALYQWDGIKLEQLGVKADDIVDQSFPYGEAASLAGAKVREVEALDSVTGQLVYQCSASKCYQSEDQAFPAQWVQLLKASVYRVTVRLAQETTGEEMWNFTVGEVDLSLVGLEEDGGSADYAGSVPLQVDAARGVVYGEEVGRGGGGGGGGGGRAWHRKMSAPITSLWVQDGLRLSRVNLSSHSALPSHQRPTLMMVHYNEKFYIQPMPPSHDVPSFHAYSSILYTLAGAMEVMAAQQALEQSKEDREEEEEHKFELSLYHNSDLFELCSKNSEGTAVYFTAEEAGEGTCQHSRDENSSEEMCAPSPSPHSLEEKSWWGRVVRRAAGVAKYLAFGVFIIALDRLHQKFGRKRTSSSASSIDTPGEGVESRDHPFKTTSSSTLENSVSSRKTLRSDSSESRFGSDYELRGRLGKGGFGVVYHVKNRTDDGEYAVKRILLPRKKSAREKVMREVHALAQLDHANIVRYFHSWVEQAPEGWQSQEQWVPLSRTESYACAEQSPFPSTVPSSSVASRRSGAASPSPSSSFLPSNPSFSTLSHDRIHSELPPPLTSQSHTSSFVIEFRNKTTDGEESATGEGDTRCFPRDLMDNRDDLSSSSHEGTFSDSTHRESSNCVHQLEAPTYLFIQMQLCQKESLKDWLAKNVHNRPQRVVSHYFQQVLEAVMYVHQKGLMHRDLKPSNIFFSLEGSVKVGDFGLVTGTAFAGSSQGQLQSLKPPQVEESIRHTGNIGSHFYMGPEQAAGKKYDQKVDIYSLGVIFFELHHPFDTEMERVKVLESLRQRELPNRFLSSMPQESALVKRLMEPRAALRPTTLEITASKLFKDLCRAAAVAPDNQLIPKL